MSNLLFKYPRTPHLPWSNGTNDDKFLKNIDNFRDKRIILSTKYDGENTTVGKDYTHARSLDSRNHPSRNWLKQFAATFQHNIPEGWRICGENLYARHSIEYTDLASYFYGFSVWNSLNECLSWSETVEWFEIFNIQPVSHAYLGVFDEEYLKKRAKNLDRGCEGYVIRNQNSFRYEDFSSNVAKYVRPNHVQTDSHWMNGPITPNKLRKEDK